MIIEPKYQYIISLILGYGFIGILVLSILLYNKYVNKISKTTVSKENLSAMVGRSISKILKYYFFLDTKVRRLIYHFDSYIGLIIGLALFILLIFTNINDVIVIDGDLKSFFLAIGGLIGTMLALILTLSIIPIQKATEAFSPSVVNLYKNDSITRLIYFLLALFSISSFVASINGFSFISKKFCYHFLFYYYH
jgi:hypothetical protein